MFINYDSTLRLSRKLTGIIFLIAFWMTSSAGFAQIGPFKADSIPLVGDDVVLNFRFKSELSKEEMQKRVFKILDQELNPYSGVFLENTSDVVASRVTDYLDIRSKALSTFAMYMTYDLKFTFYNGSCDILIRKIVFMDKGTFEIKEQRQDENLYFREFSGKEVMVDHEYTQLFARNSSERITEAAIARFNEIVNILRVSLLE